MQFLVPFAAAAVLVASPAIAAEPPAGAMVDIVQPTTPTNRSVA